MSAYYPGVLTIQEYSLSRSTHYPGVLTVPPTSPDLSVFFPEMGLGIQTTDADWIITEIDNHLWRKENGYL